MCGRFTRTTDNAQWVADRLGVPVDEIAGDETSRIGRASTPRTPISTGSCA